MALAGGGAPRYVLDVDVEAATVTVGSADDLLVDATPVSAVAWSAGPVPPEARLAVQTSAHGSADPATLHEDGGQTAVRWDQPRRRVAPGQAVVFYEGDEVVGGATAT